MKRKLLLILSLVLISVMTFSLCACNKEPQTGEPDVEGNTDLGQEYSFSELDYTEGESWYGYEIDWDDTEGTVWSMMYTEQTNAGGVFDISAISQVKPESETYSSVYAFKAPYDGCYSFTLSYTIGGEKNGGDGVSMAVYADTEPLYRYSLKDDLTARDVITLTASLEAGKYLYVIADPNESTFGDIFVLISISADICIPYTVDNVNSWAFGRGYTNDRSVHTHLSLDNTKQGTNGWYLSCSDDSKPGIIPQQLNEFISGPEEYGDMYGFVDEFSDKKALYWQAPESGTYTVITYLGYIPVDFGDGMTISFWENENKIAAVGSSKLSNKLYSMNIALNKGECFTLMVDTNETRNGDTIEGMYVFIRKNS